MNIKSAVDLIESLDGIDGNLKPAVDEFVKGISTIGKAFNASLAPLRGYVWAIEQIEAYIAIRAAKRFCSRSPEEITKPNIRIAGTAINYLRLSASEGDERIREMFADLLLASMDTNTSHLSHPSFVEIVNQLSGEEAVIIETISSMAISTPSEVFICKFDYSGIIMDAKPIYTGFPFISEGLKDVWLDNLIQQGIQIDRETASTYLNNLMRLGLITIESFGSYDLSKTRESKESRSQAICFTDYGRRFVKVAVGELNIKSTK